MNDIYKNIDNSNAEVLFNKLYTIREICGKLTCTIDMQINLSHISDDSIKAFVSVFEASDDFYEVRLNDKILRAYVVSLDIINAFLKKK